MASYTQYTLISHNSAVKPIQGITCEIEWLLRLSQGKSDLNKHLFQTKLLTSSIILRMCPKSAVYP